MNTTIKYVLLVALTDKILLILIAGLFAIAGISFALASTLPLEEQQTALVFNASASRLLLVIGCIVFVSFHIRQAFDAKEIDVILSRPISRGQLICAYWIGFACICVGLVLASAGVTALLAPINMRGFALWNVSMLFELWLVSAISLFVSLILSSAVTSVITGLAIYIMSRMIGFFLATVHARFSAANALIQTLMRHCLDIVSTITPRLDFFSDSAWLLYGAKDGVWQAILPCAAQTTVFVPLVLLAASVDMRKKQF
jgi:ABC-type transport system involved in multi-copper enzyme maturation permease subunit